MIEWRTRGQVAAFTAFVLVALMLGLRYMSPRDGLLLSAASGVAAIIGAILLLQWEQRWLPPSAILFGAMLAYPLWSWRRLESAQRFMDAELRELHESEPMGAVATVPERGTDPMEDRIAIVHAAAERQRAIRKARDDTMRFISHDIRSPLASIITLVEGGAGAADATARLKRTGHYAQCALDLADDFFRLTKAEAIDIRKFEEVDLSALAQDAADEVWPAAERKHIVILVKNEGNRDATVRGDSAQLSRALINLLGNAIKFSPELTTIRISLRDAGDWQELDITDQGCGVALEDIGTLFTRYGRIGKSNQPGIGLGLVIVKTIIERHGGTITVDSTPDIGSTFRIRLPGATPQEI
jgi:signal transduction histidine kinase